MSLIRTVPMLLASRRAAVAQGELSRVWPGAALDIVTLVWFRYTWHPIRDAFRGPGPDEVYHSPDGDCPLCRNRPAPPDAS